MNIVEKLKQKWGCSVGVIIAVVIVIIAIIVIVVLVKLVGFGSDKPDFEEKTLKVTTESGSFGEIGIKVVKNKKGKYIYRTAYRMLLKVDLPFNSKCGPKGSDLVKFCQGNDYEYGGRLVRADKPVKDEKSGHGWVNDVHCNKDIIDPDPFAKYGNESVHSEKTCLDVLGKKGELNLRGIKTDTFLSEFTIVFNSYEDILASDTFEFYDLSDYWIQEGENTYSTQTDKAVYEQDPVAIIKLNISE